MLVALRNHGRGRGGGARRPVVREVVPVEVRGEAVGLLAGHRLLHDEDPVADREADLPNRGCDPTKLSEVNTDLQECNWE